MTVPKKKKKKPPQAPVKKRKRAPVTADAPVEAKALVPVKEKISNDEIRANAAYHYITNLDRITMLDLHDVPPYNQVSIHTLRSWAAQDDWFGKRKAHFENLQIHAAKVMSEKMVATRAEHVDHLAAILRDTQGMIQMTPPKTREGMIGAYVKGLQLLDVLTDKIANVAQGVFTQKVAQGSSMASKVKPSLSKAEARAAAMAVIEKRQEEVRKRVAEGKPEEE